jgi:hypothetical protein
MLVALIVVPCCALGACSPATGQTSAPASGRLPTPTDTPPAGAFYFTTEDGVTLNGQILGQGKTALAFSNGLDLPKFVWRPVAEQFASQGYLCLPYDYRGLSPSQGRDELARRDSDLRAAVAELLPSRSPPRYSRRRSSSSPLHCPRMRSR